VLTNTSFTALNKKSLYYIFLKLLHKYSILLRLFSTFRSVGAILFPG
jgi:hypothetical protein